MNMMTDLVEHHIQQQKDYFYSGQTQTISFRKEQLLKLREAIEQHEKEIVEALQKDLGKSEFEAYATEVGILLDSISNMLKHLDDWAKPTPVKTPLPLQPAKSMIIREPYGCVLIISPFNYPFQLAIEPLIGAIIGGNTAIIKPSEATVHTTAVIKKIISETFPPYYVTVIEGEVEMTQALIHAPFDYIFFTGSVPVGKIVMKAAAERLTPITLELGGKSPAIVDQTANLAVAAERIAWGKFTNAGQTCIAPDYVVVHRDVKEKFIHELTKTIQRFYGKESMSSPDFGRIVNEKHVDRLADILKKDENYIIFGGSIDREQRFVEPTLLDISSWEAASMEDEIFGPILPIMTYENLPEILHHIRLRPKPLAAYMFTENDRAAEYFLDNLSFGGGCINDTVMHIGNPNLPFGGVGPSGMSAYHGYTSFETFTHAKSILKKGTKLPLKVMFPPYKNKVKLIKKLLK